MRPYIHYFLTCTLAIALTATCFPAGPRGGGGVRSSAGSSVNRSANVNRNADVNRNANVNVNRNVNVNANEGNHGGCCYHPVGRAATIATTAAVTAAVVGSSVSTLPPACSVVDINGVAYQNCGGTWYQPEFSGGSTTYIVVNPPQ